MSSCEQVVEFRKEDRMVASKHSR